MARFNMARFNLARFNLARFNLARFNLTRVVEPQFAHLLLVASCLQFMLAPTRSHAQPPQPNATTEQEPEGTGVQEMWYGTLDAESRIFRFVLELHSDDNNNDNKQWTGSLLSLDEGRAKFPLDSLRRDDQQLSFEIKASAARFESQLANAGKPSVGKPSADKLSGDKTTGGKWKQGRASLDLNFVRVDAVPPENITTLWTGQLNAVVQKLDVAFRELASGQVLFDSLSQRAGGFVATKTINGDEVIFEVPAIKAKFTGKQNAEGSEIVGSWRQGLVPLSLTLTKSDIKALEVAPPNRPQTPQPPFPYDSALVTVANSEQAGVELSGTLTLPHGVDRAPAVILISGSGPQDRDETIVDHKPFWVIADHLSRNGIAVLRFDDRGVGESKGNHAAATSLDFASDVRSLFQFLQSHERIDPERIGLCGHSEGGLIAPMVAAREPQVAFVILMAGTGVNGEKILISQSRLLLEASGVPAVEIERQAKSQKILIDLAKQSPPLSLDAFKTQAFAAIEPHLSQQELASEQAKLSVAQAAAQLTSPWFRFFLSYEPTDALKQLTCPALVLNGEKDLQVDPKLNLPAIEAALKASQSTHYQLFELLKLNHLFQTCQTGNVSEYAEIEETISPQVLSLITDWILQLP